MKILITGAAGFIGSHIAQTYARLGHDVLGIDNFDPFYSFEIKMQNVREAGLEGKIVPLDILDSPGLQEVFHRFLPDLVVHLAAKAGVRQSMADPVSYAKVNIQGTLSVYEACRSTDVKRVILASSSSVYGSRNTVPFREGDCISFPQSPYAASKVAAELFAGTYARLYGISTAALRFFTVYGPRQRPDLAVALFSSKILDGNPIPVFGDGSTQRDYTYIDDILDGVLKVSVWLTEQKETVYEVFNLGESRTVTLSELIRLLEKTLGRSAVVDRRTLQPGDVPLTCADIEKAQNTFGYNPKVSLEEGISRYYRWIQTTQNKESS